MQTSDLNHIPAGITPHAIRDHWNKITLAEAEWV